MFLPTAKFSHGLDPLMIDYIPTAFTPAGSVVLTGGRLGIAHNDIHPNRLGNSQATATLLIAGFNFVTGANAAVGAVLPAGAIGKTVLVKNSDAANAALQVYPPVGGTINAIGGNGALAMAAKTAAEFICLYGNAWYTTPLIAS